MRSTARPSARRSDVARVGELRGKLEAVDVEADADDDLLDALARARHLGEDTRDLLAAPVGIDELDVVWPLEPRRQTQTDDRVRHGGAHEQRQRRNLVRRPPRAEAAIDR